MNTLIGHQDTSVRRHDNSIVLPEEPSYIVTSLLTIWSELLNLSPIGLDDPLFDYGADSITVLKLIFRIQQTFHIHLRFRDVFDTQTINTLARLIEVKLRATISLHQDCSKAV